MRTRMAVGVLLVLAVGAADARTAEAQEAADPCTWDACALRLEYRFTGMRVVRGLDADPVATVGMFRGSIRDVVARSDSAVSYAAASDRHRTTADAFGVIGIVAGGLAMALTFRDLWNDGGSGAAATAALGVSVSTGLISQWQRARSFDALEQSIWWYNRDLGGR